MAYAMTKQGSLDNAVVYEFVCDTIADMNTIQNKYRTIGSIAVVLKGESEGLEVYIAGSDKQWNSLSSASGSDSLTGGGLTIYICAQNEVSNGVPSISEPDESTVYLVSNNGDTGNLYDEFIYVNNAWEKWGSAGIDVSGFAPKADPVFTGSISLGRMANSTVGSNSVAEGNGTTASGNNSHAEGAGTRATGQAAHAEGGGTQAAASNAHAEGSGTQATASQAHAEGGGTKAFGENSHAEGGSTEASGINSHAEGLFTTAIGANEHVSGRYNKLDTADTWTANTSYTVGALVKREESYADAGNTIRNITTIYKCKTANSDSTFNSSKWEESGEYLFVVGNGSSNNSRSNAFSVGWTGNVAEGGGTASGARSHAEGGGSAATGIQSHAEGGGTTASGINSHTEGSGTIASASDAHAEGTSTTASGNQSHAEGASTTASGGQAHAEGTQTTASENFSHAEGGQTKASGIASHAEGYGGTYTSNNVTYESKAAGMSDHTEGFQCLTAIAQPGNHAEGYQTRATGGAAHAEGNVTLASGNGAHSEGTSTTASGAQSHAQGAGTTASGAQSHAEGSGTIASGAQSHAEGYGAKAFGYESHAEGFVTIASGDYSHTEGNNISALGYCEHASGQYNVLDTANTWTANTSYSIGDIVKREESYVDSSNTTRNVTRIYRCTTANTDSTFTSSKWQQWGKYLVVVGNGIASNARSNAYALDWNGNEYIAGDLYVGCAADSTGGTKVATVSEVPDIQINGTSIINNRIANIPIGSGQLGVVKIDDAYGIGIYSNTGAIFINYAGASVIKDGENTYKPIVPKFQHQSVFYGLAKAAGDNTQAVSSNTIGTYTDGAKTAIKNMLGVLNIPAPSTATDGTYNLQATVSSGTITYSWVAAPASANGVSF